MGWAGIRRPVSFRTIRGVMSTALGFDYGGDDELVYLLHDEFTTPDAAPVTSPRTCEPGPGTLTSVQTDGTQALSGGKHVFTAQSTPAWGDQGFYDGEQTRAAGLALVDTLNLTTWEECGIGWHAAAAVVDPDSMEHAIQANTTDGRLDNDNATPIATGLSTSTNYRLAQILRSVGCFDTIDGALAWVSAVGSTASLYPSFANLDGAGSNDDYDVIDLPANNYTEWGADFSTVTDSKSAPADQTQFNCKRNCHVRTTFTFETGKYTYIYTSADITGSGYYIRVGALTDGKLNVLAVGTSGNLTYLNKAAAFSDGVSYQLDVVVNDDKLSVFLDNVNELSESDVSTVPEISSTNSGEVRHTLATNDIELSTHPYPSLGIATSRIIAPQANDTATMTADALVYGRGVTLPSGGTLQYDFRGAA